MTGEQDQARHPANHAIEAAVQSGKLSAATGAHVTRWLNEPYYAEYRDQLVKLIESADYTELSNLFWERIPFGTGGRRGPMSLFGSATINSRTIAESADGLAVYVKRVANASQNRVELRAVVARDTRNRSAEFARLTASILAAHGFKVFFFQDARATPELSFAVRHLECQTGVMISASHNPPSDNGFKAYWSTGGQVLPPHDAGIIECVDAATEIPVADFDQAVSEGRIVVLAPDGPTSNVDAAYVNAVCDLALSKSRKIRALYTPMHGVGASSIWKVIQQAGFQGVELYAPQCTQDGNFPNVPNHLPNPELPQALTPAIEFARQHRHDLVLASDPDADRLAIAVRTTGDEFVCLTGNQLGALLVDYVLRKRSATGSLTPEHFVVETLVTTPMFVAIGQAYGIKVIRELLVGFKYIGAAIDENGPDKFLFAAEESVGYLAGQYCRDKDASVAALFGLELASELAADGQTLLDRLDALYFQHGYFHETQFVQVCPGADGNRDISNMMRALRETPPATLGPISFASLRDYQTHQVKSLPDNTRQSDLPHPSGNLIIFEGQYGRCRVSFAGRPSGTEPKIKFYSFVNVAKDVPLAEAKSLGRDCLAQLQSSLKEWLTTAVRK